MRKAIFLLLFCTGFVSVFAAPRAVIEWLRGFEAEAKAHDQEAILRRMDPDYLRAQYKEFHEGDAVRFLGEFFCGHKLGNNNFVCPEKIDEIVMLSYIGMQKHKGRQGYEVTYHIKLSSGDMIETKWLLVMKGRSVSGWEGARG